MAGNNKTLEKRRKFECEVCAKAYTSQGPFDKHIGKCTKDQQTKEVTSQTTEETNETSKNDEALSEVEEIMIEDHEISIDQDDLELLEWFMSDQNINLSNEDQEENQKQFKEKIQRLKTVIEKKNRVRDELRIRIEALNEKNKKLEEEMSKIKEVEADQAKSLEGKDDEFETITKELKLAKERNIAILEEAKKKKRLVKELEKDKNKLKKDIESLRINNDAMARKNNELESAHKALQDVCESLNIDTDKAAENDVQVAEVIKEPVLMNKNTSGHMCVTCEQRFKTNAHLERHMDLKHTEHECFMCHILVVSDQEYEKHVIQCFDSFNSKLKAKCNQCNKRFTKQDLKRHECNERENVCPECGMIGKSKEAMKEHISNEHKQQEATSQIVCKFYRRGNCYKGNECRYAHVGHARTQTNEPRLRQCRNGASCKWQAKGMCKFSHQRGENNFPQPEQSQRNGEQNRRNGNGSQRGMCWYQQNCRRGSGCNFSHFSSLTDFPNIIQGAQRPQVWNTNNGRFNH